MQEAKVIQIVDQVVDKIKQQGFIIIESSGKHVHLSKEHVEVLFGKNYKLIKKRELSQPGQFLYEDKVRLIGPKGVIQDVALLGPPRERTQVEISKTEAIKLGISAPIRESGIIDGSAGIYISTPRAMIKLDEGVIVAKRHIHMTYEDAQVLNLHDKKIVRVKVMTERPVIFEDVTVRVNENYRLRMHIDFDEANAANVKVGTIGQIIS